MQNAIGKDVAALGVGGELALINGHEFNFAADRHGLCGANEIPRFWRDDFFLAGNQGQIGPMHSPEITGQTAVIDFARQKPERKADHAGLMGQHAFQSKMGLACIGGTKNNP